MATELKYDIFDINRTTYQNEYTNPHQTERTLPSKLRSPEKVATPPPPPVYKDCETLAVKDLYHLGPFDMYGRPKEIVHTNPHDPLVYEELIRVDPSTRVRVPRVIVPPAVSLDDADTLLGGDTETRDLLTKFTYTSTMQQANQEATKPVPPRPVLPTTVVEPRADQVRLVQEDFDPMPPGWTALGKDWDRLQSRQLCDMNREFWERYAPYVRCACVDPCDGLVTDDKVREIVRLVRTDRLRQAYTVPVPTYAGYMPLSANGVALEKLPMDIADPRMTINQAYQARALADNGCKM